MTATDEQQAAIYGDAHNILLTACPGSGKSFTLIERIKRLVRDGAHPESMAAIVFTNNAAQVLIDRLQPADGSISITLGFVGTEHNFCLRHLMENGHEGATVLDQDEAVAELARVARDCNIDTSFKRLKEMKEQWWLGKRATPETVAEAIRNDNRESFNARTVIGSYYRRLEAERLLDYDSILHMALASMREVTSKTKIWEHLLIDELQDASLLDAEIYAAIPAENRFYTGDPRQSIFGFREAKAELFSKLDGDPAWLKLALTGNFRSAPEIIEAANRLIAHSETLPESARLPMVARS